MPFPILSPGFFEWPYRNARQWSKDMQEVVWARGSELSDIYFFYSTCPKCAKSYGKNYVVGVARVQAVLAKGKRHDVP